MAHTGPIFIDLAILPFVKIFIDRICITMFKVDYELLPKSVTQMLSKIKDIHTHDTENINILKGNAAYLKKCIDENDSLSEYNKIPLGYNRTNGAVYSKIYFKVEICSAL